MAIQDLLSKKINIAGREVPAGVILLGGGGIVVVFLIVRGNQAQGQTQNPIDLATQAQNLANQVGQQAPPGDTGGAGGAADISGQLSSFSTGLAQSISAMQSGFQNQITQALASQNQQSQAALAQLQSELSQYAMNPASAMTPSIFPQPEAVAVPMFSGPAPFPTPPARPAPVRTQAPAPTPAPAPAPRPAQPTVPLGQLQTAPKPPAPVSSQVLGSNPELAYTRPQTTPGPSGTYTVQSGNTLSGIAKKYGVGLSALINANPQIANPNLIRVGQVINIPGSTTTSWGGGNPFVGVT